MTIPPLIFTWSGDAMVPQHPKLADKHYVIGQKYRLVEELERSAATHAHFFAIVNECWRSLPENLAERFPTPEALRKFALIRAGYRDERSIVCASKAEAHRVAAFIKPIDEYAVVLVSEAVVTFYTAKSQSMKAMGKEEFAKSKEAVFDEMAKILGVDVSSLPKSGAA